MARLIEFEGRLVEVPDDATDDEIAYILDQPASAAPQAARPVASAQPAAAPSMLDTIMGGVDYAAGTLGQVARGARRGVANVVGLPVDIVNAAPQLLNILPGVDGVGPMSPKPVMGSDFVDQLLGGFVTPEPAAPNGLVQRGARRVGEEVGAAAVPVAGALARGAQLGAGGVRASGNVLDTIMGSEAAAVDPGRFLGAQAAAAAGAGMGATAAGEAVRAAGADPNGATARGADFLGALSGAGLTALGGTLLKSGANVVNAVRGSANYVDDTVKEAVVDRIAEAAGLQSAPGAPVDVEPLVSAIMAGPRVSQAVPGVVESTADRTGNAGLAALEYGRQSGPNAGMFARRRNENANAIDAAFAQFEPQGTPGAFRGELDARRMAQITDATAEAERARQAAEAAARPLAPQGTPATRGNTVRSALEDARDEARQQTAEAYKAANVDDKPIAPDQLAAAIDNVLAPLTEVERGLLPQGMLDRVRGLARAAEGPGPVDTGLLDANGRPITRAPEPPEPARMKEATDLRSELLRLQRGALADPRAERGGRNAARVLGDLVDTVDAFIRSNLGPDEIAAIEAARGAKFSEAERFTRQGDPVAAALARYEGGQPKMRDERVAGTFTNPQNLERLLAQADTPDVRRAIRDEMLAGVDLQDPEAVQAFMRDNFEALRNFPGLDTDLVAAASARANADSAAKNATELTERLTKQGKSAVANYLTYADENADRAMRGVLAARDPKAAINELLDFAGNEPGAVEGARKVFWDIMAKSSKRAGETTATLDGTQPWMPKALQRFLDDSRNAAVAERLYRDNPEHLENVKKIAGAIQGLDVRNSGKVPNTSGTAQSILPSAETLGSRIFAYQRGQVGAGWLVTNLVAIAARRATKGAQTAAIERMLDEALLNPEAAALLLRDNNPVNRTALGRAARAYLGNEASTLVNMLSAEDKDPTTETVMGGR
jgi:hypothetical protein